MGAGKEDAAASEVRTCCRCCPAGCGIVVQVDGERVVGVKGDRDHPISRGYTCPKGRALPDFHHRTDRLDVPHGPDGLGGSGAWGPVLDDLTARLRALIAGGGPDAVGLYRATGTSGDTLGRRTAERFVHQLGSRQYYSAATVDVAPAWRAAEMVTGGGRELTPVWVPEDPASRFVLFVGCNPVVSHGYLTILADPVRRLRAVQRRGGRVWVCDPRTTATARLADGHVAPRPGTDAVLLAGLVAAVLADGADGGADDIELATRVTPGDLVALRAAVAPFTPDRVATRCDVPVALVEQLIAEVRAAGRIGVVAGTGVTFGHHALVTEWLRWALLVVTGSLDRPGGMWFNPGWMVATEQRERWDHAPPGGRVEPGLPSRPDLPRLFGQSPCAALVDEIEAGRLRALFVAGGSPLTAFPDPDRTAAAFRRLDVLAVVDVVGTPLSRMATHVLPATGQLERTDLVTLERTMVAPAAVPAAASRRPTWWIFDELGHRLGLPSNLPLPPPSNLPSKGERALLPFRGQVRAEDAERDLLRGLCVASRGGADELFAAGSHGVPSPRLYGWVRDQALPDGRWRLTPPGMLDRLAALLADEPAGLQLVSRRQVDANNATRYVADARSKERPQLLVHPDDAAERGIVDGSPIEVTTASGAVTATVRLDDHVRRGTVSLPHGWHDTNVGRLTDPHDVDPLTTQPRMSGFPVELRA